MMLAILEKNGPDRLLISQDAGWYNVGEPDGGKQKPFTPIHAELLPALRDRGVKEAVLWQLTTMNPQRAFMIG